MLTSVRIASQLRSVSNIRLLYSPASIGVEDYVKTRQKYVQKIEFFEKFQNRMREFCQKNDATAMIFTEDLKQFLHLTSGTDEELSLIEMMMEKFNQQNSQLRFGTYNFGPVVMRMYHHFNKPEEAVKAYNNSKLDGFFDQLSTHVILMDLMFKNEKYEEIVALYDKMKHKQLFFGKYPKSILVLLFAACYKINSEQMFNYAVSLWKEISDSGLLPLRRATCFVAALALNHNSPHISLEIISSCSNQNFVLIRSLKVCSFCTLGRMEDVFPVLTSVLTFDTPSITKQTFPRDVIQKVKEAVEKHSTKELSFEFLRIEKQLRNQNHISEKTLDELLLSEISMVQPINQTKSVLRVAFNGSEDASIRKRSNTNMFRRPGLLDMS